MTPKLRPWLRRPVILAALGVLVLAAAGGGYWLSRGGGTPAAATTYRLVAAQLGTVRQAVSASGTIEPAQQESLGFSASGRVTSVKVSEGDVVKAGQVLAAIDSAALKASLAQAKATLAGDEARVAADDTGTAQLAADQAAVTAAKGQVSSAQAALAGASLTSPIAGVVASVGVEVGQQVAGSSGAGGSDGSGSGGEGSAASTSSAGRIVVIGTSSWLVNTAVDDTEVGLIAKGQQAQVSTDGVTRTMPGTVASVAVVASAASGTASYPVVVDITGSPTGLHAGATATVSLIYKQLSNVVTVPSLAVHISDGRRVVYELSGGKQVPHPVSTGLSSDGRVQITAGLAAGDQVVVPGAPAATTRGGSGSTGNSENTGNTRGGGSRGGGFGGGGFGGGGFGNRGGGN